MAQPFSNKIEKPLFDFTSLFGMANSTPMMLPQKMQPLIPVPGIKSAQAQSTTPAVAGRSTPDSLGAYKGVPIKFGDQASIIAQMRAIDASQGTPTGSNAPVPAAGDVPPTANANLRGLVPAPTPQPGQANVAAAAAASPTFSGLIYEILKKATEEDKNVSATRSNAEKINKQIQAQREELANTVAGIRDQAIPLEFQQGREQVVQSQGADILAGLGEQFAGASNLANQALTQRGQTLEALQQAASLGQPSPAAFGQTTFDPLQGGFSGGAGLPPDVMQHYAQMAASGQYSAIPSFITGNPVLNAQLNVAAKAFNPNFTPIGAQGASGVLSTIPALQSAETAAEGIKNTIVSYLNQNPQLNPSDLAAGNILQQWIQGKQLTDPKYQTLFNYLNEYTNTLAPILGVGGDTTNLKTQIAQSFVNAAASGQSISEVLNSLSQLAANKVIDLQRGATGQGTVVPSVPFGGTPGGFAEAW